MVAIGKRNRLAVSRDSVHGLFLDAEEMGEILLPGRQPAEGPSVGDFLDVFVYRDSEDRLVATRDIPLAMVGDFACLNVVSVNRQIGAFLDWGLPKDLLLPFREQRDPVFAGDKVVVYVHLDPKSDRVVATTRLNLHLSRETPRYAAGQAVNILIAGETPLGYSAIVEGSFYGLLYRSALAISLDVGQTISAFVTAVRPDGKIDLSLDAVGYQRVSALTDVIIEALERGDGRMALDDNSSPEAIREAFGVSKKAFKQALGWLYKKRLIAFTEPGTCLAGKSASQKEKKKPVEARSRLT
jgi:uncharacterized protein